MDVGLLQVLHPLQLGLQYSMLRGLLLFSVLLGILFVWMFWNYVIVFWSVRFIYMHTFIYIQAVLIDFPSSPDSSIPCCLASSCAAWFLVLKSFFFFSISFFFFYLIFWQTFVPPWGFIKTFSFFGLTKQNAVPGNKIFSCHQITRGHNCW